MNKNTINSGDFENLSLYKLNNNITKAINDFAKIQEMRFFLYDYQDVLEKIIYLYIKNYRFWEQKNKTTLKYRKILNSKAYSMLDNLGLQDKEKKHIMSFVVCFLDQNFDDRILDGLDMRNEKLSFEKEIFSESVLLSLINGSKDSFLLFIFDIYKFFIKENDREDNYESYINTIITDCFSGETKEFREELLKLGLNIHNNLKGYKKTINCGDEYLSNNFENIIIIILEKCKFENIILKKELHNSINLAKDILKKITNISENLSSQK